MLDSLDFKILGLLQKDARIKLTDLAKKTNLSVPSLTARIQKLESSGVIKGYFTKIDRKLVGYDIMVIIDVIMESSKNYKSFISHVEKTSEIIECYSILGEASHVLKAVVKDTRSLEKLLSKIQSWPGVTRTITRYVLSEIKEENSLTF